MRLKSEVVTSLRRVANSHSGFDTLWWGSNSVDNLEVAIFPGGYWA